MMRGLYPSLLPGEYLELRCAHHETGEVLREWFTDAASLERRACALSLRGYHAWYGINPRKTRAGGDANCTRAYALPADIDAKHWDGDLDVARAAVEAFPLRPSANVCSGGGFQPRWFLDEPLDLQDAGDVRRYRLLAMRLARALCGADRTPDMVNNPERILRVPGTLNWKPAYGEPRPVTVAWCEPAHRYRAADLAQWLDVHAPWTIIAPPPAPAEPPRAHASPGATSGRIGDFNDRYDPLPLLLLHGAHIAHVHGTVTHLTRPGKQRGTSATYNYYPGTLIVFSEHWPPFAAHRADGQGWRGYDAFAVYTLLAHGGDARAAYRAAADLGYGAHGRVTLGHPGVTLGHPGVRYGIRVVSGSAHVALRRLVGA